MPDDKTQPIIMVGAGTGIAPFRSFWQERKIDMEMMPKPNGINGNNWGEMILYFGCRQAKVDELYRNELDQLVTEKVITQLHSAYSREPGKPKIYVQDILENNMDSVFDAIYNKGGNFYICGDVRMAAEVTQTLELTLQKKNNMSIEEAKEYVFRMKEEMRFHEDIFGNSINVKNN
jgi:sulfite reductase alpha subunit-like flavoprotein